MTTTASGVVSLFRLCYTNGSNVSLKVAESHIFNLPTKFFMYLFLLFFVNETAAAQQSAVVR